MKTGIHPSIWSNPIKPRECGVGEVEEVDAARRPAACDHVDALGEPRGGDDVTAEPLHELHRRGRAVLALSDDVEAHVATGRVDVVGAVGEIDSGDLGIAFETRRETSDRARNPFALGPARRSGVDDDRRRRERASTDRVAHDVQAADALEILRNSASAATGIAM